LNTVDSVQTRDNIGKINETKGLEERYLDSSIYKFLNFTILIMLAPIISSLDEIHCPSKQVTGNGTVDQATEKEMR